jgi:EmrB/QacA subfamily drug resistance transporter
MVVFLFSSAACACATSLALLIAARVVQAAGVAILMPSSLALLLPEFPAAKRASATAIWGVTGAVAAALGPSLGGVIVDRLDWRWIFAVNLPVGLLVLSMGLRLLTEQRESGAVRFPDPLGVAMLTCSVAALSLGTVKAPEWGWSSDAVLGLFVTGGTGLLLFAFRNARHPRPLIEPALLRLRSFAVGSSAAFIYSLGFFASFLCNVLFLTQVWHYSPLTAGFALSPGPLMAALAAPFAGRLCDRFGQRVMAVPGTLLFAAGVLVLASQVTAQPNYLVSFLPMSVIAGIGVGMTFAALSSAVVAEVPLERYATGGAVYSCVRQLGAVLGVSILVAVLGDELANLSVYRQAWLLIAAAAVLAGLVAGTLGRFYAREESTATAASLVPEMGEGGPA